MTTFLDLLALLYADELRLTANPPTQQLFEAIEPAPAARGFSGSA